MVKSRNILWILGTVALHTACAGRSGNVSTGDIDPVESTETERPREFGIEDVNAAAVNANPTDAQLSSQAGPVIARAQILLSRARFSVGVIDGHAAKNTALALRWFQKSQNLPQTSVLDAATYDRLISVAGARPLVRQVTVDAEMLKGTIPVLSRNVYEQARMRCLCYASVTEAMAERFHTSLEMMRRLNPGVGFAALKPGDVIWAPDAEPMPPTPQKRIARIQVAKSGNYVHAFAADGTLLYHFPSTLGSKYDPSPTGKFRVVGVEFNPVFRYDPTLFSDVPDTKPGARLPPGPNSPVGLVWIALSKEHIGIHGTPNPDTIGMTSSHGCVRLTNWDAVLLARAVLKGTPVEFTT
ncbi:MAG TPA: L,D-transpeptidase family protein [Gemmatimonadaceae bacterium]|nr:L,D-transpeptidase family protein [Gemmatimonadaceae bacterium]